ncbi:MAG: pyrimidine dimer DNA glycosylase/endonuclease V [Bacilli bacterium]|nr:pyrimidine dimer DNA glycosylase/endonuclease V [Bacilli bacterium]
MRLWHYKLIRYLPRSQLLAQWRELNLIFRQEPSHILINYIYSDKYKDKKDLLAYSNMVLKEMHSRNYRINYDNYENYFKGVFSNIINPFPDYQNDDYLIICFYNLKEKHIRGQKDFSENEYFQLLSIKENIESQTNT